MKIKNTKPKQLALLKKQSMAYGGLLLNTRAGRAHGRPLDTKQSMHLVLRSSLARGPWSFKYGKNPRVIKEIISKFAIKNGIKILSLANVGNHIHMHIKLSNRFAYKRFIRAITAAIAMKITGRSRWTVGEEWTDLKSVSEGIKPARKFWDYRPFSRVIQGFKALLTLKDYIQINQFEGEGYTRDQARILIRSGREIGGMFKARPLLRI